MTTATSFSPAGHTSDATFRAWVDEYFALIVTAGLVHVPQVGELVLPAVAVRPIAGAYAGWRVYRFNDTLQATAPIYIKIQVGTGVSANNPRIAYEVGTAVDGSGAFVGPTSGVLAAGANTAMVASVGNFNSCACHTEGSFFVAFKRLAFSSGIGKSYPSHAVYRTNDSSGAPTTEGVVVHTLDAGTGNAGDVGNVTTLDFSPGGVYNAGGSYCLFPGPSSRVNSGGLTGEIEAYLVFYLDPLTRPAAFACGVFGAEFPFGTTFSATLVGASPKTYISLAGFGFPNADGSTARNAAHALQWG